MSYHDLPEDIRSVPLDEASIQADVVDLMLGIGERRSGALGIMVCDSLDRGVQPLVLGDIPEDAPPEPVEKLLDLLLPTIAEEGGSVLVSRGRRLSLVPNDVDRAWHQAAIDACAKHAVRLLGFYLATPTGVRELPAPLNASP
jgi:hypothetical protein